MLTPDWIAARAAMLLDPSVTNLNTGSFGPTPRLVFDRVTELRRHLAAEPMDFIVRATPPLLWEARRRLAEFLGTVPARLLFTQNVSTAINIVASGLSVPPGEILLSDREYGSMHWCWERAAKRQGLTIKTFSLPLTPSSPDEIVDAVAAAIRPQTRLLFFSHVYSANGMIVPARELCTLARQNGIISVVDGAHAPALIPLNIDDLNCDFYAGNCHKWLLAPIGAGFLALGKDMIDRLEPLQVSWGYKCDTGSGWDERDEFGSTPRLRKLEFEGTRDICPWLVVPEAIQFQKMLGWSNIRQRHLELAEYVRASCRDWRLATPTHPAMHGPMTAFWAPTDLPADEVRRRLWERRIEIPVTDWPDGRIMRVSTHFYTTEEEVDRFVDAAPGIFSDASTKRR